MSDPSTLNTFAALAATFSSFLTVAIHTILYERGIYPATTFLSARKYNCPVRQNRHPKVCQWINDAVAAVENELLKGTVARVALVIYSPSSQPLERFLFDLTRFPAVPPSQVLTEFEDPPAPSEERPDSTTLPTKTNLVDLEEQFRGVMRRLANCGSSLGKLPDDCSYTVAIELKDRAEPPIGHPQPWIPSQPDLQPPVAGKKDHRGHGLGGIKTTPVRAVEAGEFVLEMWIEEGKDKIPSIKQATSAKTSFS
ncbi:MAG: hypothetical protein M1817_005390 [Caeruleum heppii]|nr:MAG: hypothetical protein M1817_005390 [Caeruleum heppii]